jgi:hypothetical protein
MGRTSRTPPGRNQDKKKAARKEGAQNPDDNSKSLETSNKAFTYIGRVVSSIGI